MLRRPGASWVTVVSGGLDRLAAGMSSKPTTATSGTAQPMFCSACIAPIAATSWRRRSRRTRHRVRAGVRERRVRRLARVGVGASLSSASIPAARSAGNIAPSLQESGWPASAVPINAICAGARRRWWRRTHPAHCLTQPSFQAGRRRPNPSARNACRSISAEPRAIFEIVAISGEDDAVGLMAVLVIPTPVG